MKAVIRAENTSMFTTDYTLGKLPDDHILVRNVAVALNPTDWKHAVFGWAAENGLLGCDFAGVVEQVGTAVTKHWKKGDRVAGVAHGGNFLRPTDGTFADFITAKGDLQMKIPESMTFERAATIGLGAITCGQGLYQKGLKLKLPTEPVSDGTPVLIYGGSTATGALAIQFVRLSGYRVITTCSVRNSDYVKKLGAEKVFDYNDPTVASQIREFTHNKLKFAYDTVGQEESAKICAESLSTEPGCRYSTIYPVQRPRDDIAVVSTLMYTIFNEDVQLGSMRFSASVEDFEFARSFMGMTETLLGDGRLTNHREKIGENGLLGVVDGLNRMQEGKVRGEKLVYRVADTP